MQLGIRWNAGDPPHESVPSALHGEIEKQERLHPGAHSWTLTWLEGRPRCTLDASLVISLSARGDVVTTTPQRAEPGLERPAVGHVHGAADDADFENDDDEWLK